ncbi:MAG: hypothetical protein ACXABX_03575, partial [Candidatus Thorarchaeota archaeon]
RRILNYTAEIILSIILLVLICIPLVFVIPMWFQHIVLGLPRAELALDPVHWFGLDGATWLTLLFGLVSFALSYVFILRLKPGTITEDEPEEEEPQDEEDEEELEVDEEEEIEEELAEEGEEISEEEPEEEFDEETEEED